MSHRRRILLFLATVLVSSSLTVPARGQEGLVLGRARVSGGLPPAVEVRLVDLDRDGLLDVVRLTDERLVVLLQDPAGRMVPTQLIRPPLVPAGTLLRDVGVGDLDAGQNGAPDLVLLYSDGSAEVLLNNGTGTLAALSPRPVQSAFSTTGSQVLVDDVNGDGFDDIVLLEDAVPPLMFLADRMGGFVDVTSTNVPSGIALTQPRGVLTDFDGDADLDLVLVAAGNTVPPLLLENTGGANLVPNGSAMPPMSLRGRVIVAADILGGPLPELIVGVTSGNRRPPEIYRNTAGTYSTTPAQAFTIANPRELLIGDVSGDGVPDLLALEDDGAVVVGVNDGFGRFGQARQILSGAGRLTADLGDLEGDGDADLYTAGALVEDQILLGDGLGNWFDTEAVDFPIGAGPDRVLAALVDIDGNVDLDFVGYTGAGRPWVFRNDGSAAFTGPPPAVLPHLPQTTTWQQLCAVAVLGAQRRDLLVRGGRNALNLEPLRVLVQRAGIYRDETATRWPQGLGQGYLAMAVAPIGVGLVGTTARDDVVLATTAGELQLVRNTSGVYAVVSAFPSGLGLWSAAQILIADLDRNGSLDVVVLGTTVSPRVFLGMPGPQFVERPNAVAAAVTARDGVLSDLDGDGILDLLLLPPPGTAGVFALRGDGSGGFIDVTGTLLPPLSASYEDAVVLDLEGARRIVLARWGGADHMLTLTGGAYGRPRPLPFRGNVRSVGLHAADLDLDGDQDLIIERQGSSPGLLRGDSVHLSQNGVGQLGRFLGLRMVAPTPGDLLFLFVGAPTPGPVLLAPWGNLRLVNALSLWSTALPPGQRSLVLDVPLPAALAPGRMPLQGATLNLMGRTIHLTNLEYFELTRH